VSAANDGGGKMLLPPPSPSATPPPRAGGETIARKSLTSPGPMFMIGASANAGGSGPADLARAAALGLRGTGLGDRGARLPRLAPASQRAVALETGMQNSARAFGIILSSFPEAQQRDILRLPLSYAFLVLVNASLVTLWFRRSSQPEALPEAVAS